MVESVWNWWLHRGLVDRVGYLKPFTKHAERKRVLFISEPDPICQAQTFPFFLYEKSFLEDDGIEMRELPLSHFMKKNNPYAHEMDAVLFQTWFDFKPNELERLAARIRTTWPSARIGYLDWFAPTDLRYAGVLDQYVVAYVKKQTLREFKLYETPTIGDTNLTDYYCRRFEIDLPRTHFRVPEGFGRKIVLGSNFEYSPQILKNLSKPWEDRPRDIDLHARMATKGTAWYTKMRTEALHAAQSLQDRFSIASAGLVKKRKYFEELRNSKLCFSPFGYGEVCWRDYEAMSTGALLLKPDMSHLNLKNNPFKPFETYVPLSWDLRDLPDKVEYYVTHHSERISIARNAFEQLRSHYLKREFRVDASELWKRLGIEKGV